jgi:hypothetical protein
MDGGSALQPPLLISEPMRFPCIPASDIIRIMFHRLVVLNDRSMICYGANFEI